MSFLEGKNVVLGISGGIAAYKAAELCRLLVTAGAAVTAVMTGSATRLIGPETLKALTGKPVLIDLWRSQREIPHIRIAEEADLMILAPATANVIGKLANGLADDALTTIIAARRCPLLIAPAMNSAMYESEATQRNLRLLADSCAIVGPAGGALACGESGIGRLSPLDEVLLEAERLVGPGDLMGQKVLITAGPTREFIDDVRYISNPSSGKMGLALARVAYARGADVKLLSGPGVNHLGPLKAIAFVSVDDLHTLLKETFAKADILFMTAAVGDLSPLEKSVGKLKRSDGEISIKLSPTADLLADLTRTARPGQLIFGFAAEHGLDESAITRKVATKSAHYLVVNDVSRSDIGFGSDQNEVTIYDNEGVVVAQIEKADKSIIARRLLDIAAGHNGQAV